MPLGGMVRKYVKKNTDPWCRLKAAEERNAANIAAKRVREKAATTVCESPHAEWQRQSHDHSWVEIGILSAAQMKIN